MSKLAVCKLAARQVALGFAVINLLGVAGCATQSATADAANSQQANHGVAAQVGVRPLYLVDDLDDGALKDKLQQCAAGPFYRSEFVISHRGAPLQFPEHTKEGYLAGARMGAGTLECDVTFTKDNELVCRHSQCDLAETTDILLHDDIAQQCRQPFSPADLASGKPAAVQCCTSDITLAQFKQLKGKMEGANPQATTPADYLAGTPAWRTELYQQRGTLMSLDESIALFKQLGVKQTPELKAPMVPMPFNGMTQQQYAQKLIDSYRKAGISASEVLPQSFSLADVRYWIEHEPAFGQQALFLDEGSNSEQFDPMLPSSWRWSMAELKQQGVTTIAPAMWMLLTVNADGEIVPSRYALEAKKAGLKIVAWSFERSGPLANGGGWYYQSVQQAIHKDGDMLKVLDVLAKQVGVSAIFSDWPGTVTYYANCMEL
ncbi:glycerophosphodiester phosphodiesterase [Shewanella sp. C32]|uniref:glycerophosphodiester phosphodiesterase n=1 Tax=Shewanella electrica TaxID=515560 RepID=A0ABT2FQH0_9GAMM|nr:glycerophosphodiester phosphodiesterase family protein [Shewanella electrica]MCH1926973.1 glycerophosphodiester phosphodiesterase [Shewanella electrica]MCS4558594.1 glycerophosphodiester phosphodiesterase [Shewanella electrica]